MPSFFDPNNLTDAQKARWDAAAAEYARIQEANLDLHLTAMSLKEQTENQDTLEERPRAGDSKSALFARLLEGKPALPFPPPTSYSYPWYSLIEEPDPHPAAIGWISAQTRQTSGASNENTASHGDQVLSIGINQCTWVVVSLNEAARRLMALQDRLTATATQDNQRSFRRYFSWTPELLEEVIATYAAFPEFVVRFGPWAEYRLKIGRGQATCRRGYLRDSVTDIASRRCDHLAACGNVFDVNRFYLNWEEGLIVSKGEHPKKRLEKAETCLDQLTKNFPGLDHAPAHRQIADLQKEIAIFEVDPPQADFVQITYDDWVLEKAFINTETEVSA